MNFPLGSGFYLAYIYSLIVKDLSEATLNLTGLLVPINILRADPAFYVAAVEREQGWSRIVLGLDDLLWTQRVSPLFSSCGDLCHIHGEKEGSLLQFCLRVKHYPESSQ